MPARRPYLQQPQREFQRSLRGRLVFRQRAAGKPDRRPTVEIDHAIGRRTLWGAHESLE
jgi:hypothetical protein